MINVFILAAGIGERLRPITDCIPKPLLPILGKPIILSVLERVSMLPIKNIGINLCYKKELIENWIRLSSFSNIYTFIENPVLGTGGALKNAESFLKDSPFLVHNSDILTSANLEKLIDFHLSSKNLATLAVHNYPDFNKLKIDRRGFLKGVVKNTKKGYLAFTGIAMYEPEIIRFLPYGNSSIIDAWFNAMSEGYKIGTMDVSGCYWTDIGTPSSYAKTIINELRKDGEMIYIHPSTNGCNYAEMDGYIVIEKKSIVNKPAKLRNCIILPKTLTGIESYDKTNADNMSNSFTGKKNDHKKLLYENCILGPNFRIDLNESDFLNKTENDIYLIGTGGSDRKYFRVKENFRSAIIMQSPENDLDFQRHIEYTLFFKKYSVSVPELIEIDTDKRKAFFEDLGDFSLFSWLKCQRSSGEIETIYKKVLDILIAMHTIATEHLSECLHLQNRIFDYEHLRWETSYFIERFVVGVKQIKISNPHSLDKEFHRLALKADSFTKTVIHRDFQSQNIMITKGENPRIIDYQGARIGPPGYDVASIFWDPYHRLTNEIRGSLIEYYVKKMQAKSSLFNENEFRESLLPCRLQRHMQALGAYGFLSTVKKKKYFLKHIPEGLRLLREDLSFIKNEYPALNSLVKKL